MILQTLLRLLHSRPENLWHEDFIVNLAKVLKPRVYCELWLYKCELFNRMVPLVWSAIWVDMSPDPLKYMRRDKRISFLEMSTDEYYEKIKDDSPFIDLLFIDADHSKESVLRDFQNFFPLVKDQWIILLHDGFPKSKDFAQRWTYCGDCYLAIEELSKKTNGYEMVTIPVHPGLTICRKRNAQVNW